MQNNQRVQINIDSDDLQRLYLLLNDQALICRPGCRFTDFHAEASYFRGFFSYFIDKSNQPGGVGRSPVHPSGAVDQVTTQHASKCTCDQCSCMGFGFLSAPNEGSEFYPFAVGEES